MVVGKKWIERMEIKKFVYSMKIARRSEYPGEVTYMKFAFANALFLHFCKENEFATRYVSRYATSMPLVCI